MMSRGKFWGGHWGGQAKFWGGSGPPSSAPAHRRMKSLYCAVNKLRGTFARFSGAIGNTLLYVFCIPMPANCGADTRSIFRDGFRERWALGHLSFWGLTQVWPIWPFVWKAWKYAPLMCSVPSKIYLLLCRLWFHNYLRSSTEIKPFLHSSKEQTALRFFLEFIARSCSSEVLFVQFP